MNNKLVLICPKGHEKFNLILEKDGLENEFNVVCSDCGEYLFGLGFDREIVQELLKDQLSWLKNLSNKDYGKRSTKSSGGRSEKDIKD